MLLQPSLDSPHFYCELDFIPESVNASLRPIEVQTCGGKVRRLSVTPKAKACQNLMTLKFRAARVLQDSKLTIFPICTKVFLKIEFTFPDYRVRDISNRIKSLEDALVKAQVIEDDNLVYNILCSKNIEKDVSLTKVTLLPL